jgi:benzoyl-CoA reductase/2-hydroxyglutaryl-CoA dehydratase subunit BcrC/BadD/HgdB
MSKTSTLDVRPTDVSRPSGRSFRYSPGILALQRQVENYSFYEVEEKAKNGMPAVWSMASWESPLINACGYTPISYAELWREESKEAEEVGENELQIPSEFCSMIKVLSGRLKLRGAKTINKIFSYGSTCEPISTTFEIAARQGYDVFFIDAFTAFTKEEKRPEVIIAFVKELEKIAIWLTGKPVDQDRLREEIRNRNAVLRKIRTILDLRLKAPLYLSAIPTMQLIGAASHFFGDLGAYNHTLDLLIDELTEAAKDPTDESFIPLVTAGGGPGVLNVIEESRGAILGWLLVTTDEYREDVPPLESIAHYVLDAQGRGEMGEVVGTSATLRRYRLEELVEKVGARGVITSTITGCPYGSIVQQMEREHFKKLGIPIIQLEGTVHRGRPTEEQIMRVRTFVEML